MSLKTFGTGLKITVDIDFILDNNTLAVYSPVTTGTRNTRV